MRNIQTLIITKPSGNFSNYRANVVRHETIERAKWFLKQEETNFNSFRLKYGQKAVIINPKNQIKVLTHVCTKREQRLYVDTFYEVIYENQQA